MDPDAILRVEDIGHHPVTQERVDIGRCYPDGVRGRPGHIVDWFIRGTGSDRLVLTGGTALNAVANMRLLENFGLGLLQANAGPNDAAASLDTAYTRGRRSASRGSLRIRGYGRAGFCSGTPARLLLWTGRYPLRDSSGPLTERPMWPGRSLVTRRIDVAWKLLPI